MDAARLVAAARRADAEARSHKRAERAHRQAARAAREKQAEIERMCARLGIQISYQPAQEDFHGQQTNPTPDP